MWDVKPKSGGGIGGMLRERFFSFGMVLAIGFLLLVCKHHMNPTG
jgi:membrane protein